jgi:predicted kinase
MKNVILTRGIPGSGKSTWTKEQLRLHPNQYKRVNRDDLRLMLDNEQFNPKREKFITKIQHELILKSLQEGYHVICDDTNLNPKTIESITNLVKGIATVKIQDFTHVPLEVCIQQDLKRLNSVGKDVIVKFYNQYIKPKPKKIEYIEGLPNAIIFDVDGTLSHFVDRGPFDFMSCYSDVVDNNIKELIEFYSKKNKIIIMSGRDSICMDITIKWLHDNEIKYDLIYMRAVGDSRKDSIVKRELYEKHVMNKFNVKLVFDDRDQVVNLWRELGLTCYQVAEGSF